MLQKKLPYAFSNIELRPTKVSIAFPVLLYQTSLIPTFNAMFHCEKVSVGSYLIFSF